jgi:hypothetical protein
MSSSAQHNSNHRATKSPHQEPSSQVAWQRRLLPVMVAMIVVLTVFFFGASLYQLYFVHQRINDCPQLGLESVLKEINLDQKQHVDGNFLELTRWKTLALLEGHTLQRRYHQANALLMARVWVRYLGFVTGMILALVGAVFVLGKLREPPSTLRARGSGFAGSISTTSPGLILTCLGTILMLTTILTHHHIDVKDGPLYTAVSYVVAPSETKPVDVTKLDTITPSATDQKGSAANQTSGSKTKDAGFDRLLNQAETRLKQAP